MSNIIRGKLKKNNPEEKRFIIRPHEFDYLLKVEQVKKSQEFYLNGLINEYLKMIALKYGYNLDDNLEFKIDFAGQNRELTIRNHLP